MCVRRDEWGLKLAQGVILQPVALIDCIDARVARVADEEVKKEAAILQNDGFADIDSLNETCTRRHSHASFQPILCNMKKSRSEL